MTRHAPRIELVNRLCTKLDITPSELNDIARSIDNLAANATQSFRHCRENILFLE